jgi:CheY-like chemotaxis protein
MAHLPPRCRVLVCEDDSAISAYVVDVLEAAGHHLAAVPDGESARRAAAADPPAVIILDLALPGLDGGSVLERLKADPRTAPIPVVIASAYPSWMTFLDRRLAAEVLEKPFSPDELEAVVDQAIGTRR